MVTVVAVVAVAVTGLLWGARAWIRSRVYQQLLPHAMSRMTAPGGLETLSAAECGSCHQAIHAEWQRSSMATTFTSVVFQVDWEKNGRLFLCLNCHAPLENQQPLTVTGLSGLDPLRPAGKENPAFDAELQKQGVTCVVCHLQDGVIAGPRGHAEDSPHAVREVQGFGAAEQCAPCHQFPPPPGSDVRRPPSDTVGEWRRWQQQTGRSEGCIECHMPEVERPLIPDGKPRRGRRHTFLGGRSADFLRSGLTVEAPRRGADGIEVPITNLAGHNNPTGEPARALEVGLTILAASGERALESIWLSRRIEVPELRELDDTSLLPGETRVLHFHVPPDELTAVRGARVEVIYHRLKHYPEVRERAGISVEEQRIAVGGEEAHW